MQIAGVLPFNVGIGARPERLDNSSQEVECTPEMAAWCREEIRRHPEKASALTTVADAIDRCLRAASGSR
jgi:hypothetical protein